MSATMARLDRDLKRAEALVTAFPGLKRKGRVRVRKFRGLTGVSVSDVTACWCADILVKNISIY